MLVRAHDRRVEHHPLQFRGLERVKNRFPLPFLGQPTKATPDGIGLAEAFGQVSPGAARAHYPDDSIEEQAIVFGRYAAVRDLAREERRDSFPLPVRNFMTVHILE